MLLTSQNQNGYEILDTSICSKHGDFVSFYVDAGQAHHKQCPECERDNLKHQLIEKYRADSGIPLRYAGKTIQMVEKNDATIRPLQWITKYLSVLPERLQIGTSGSLCGDVGTGKTLLGCAMVNEIINRGYAAKYITAWKMIQAIRSAYSSKETSISNQIDNFITPDFLVIDEIGVQAGSQDERVLLYQVIDGRYNEMKATLLISNIKDPVADGYLDARTIDRLKENGGFSLTLSGNSFRG